jgi:uncharacterized membrane protein YhaH (DUF805 family)
MEWHLMVWKRFAEFSGRSRRKEYWMINGNTSIAEATRP